jgi:hypothetical protein
MYRVFGVRVAGPYNSARREVTTAARKLQQQGKGYTSLREITNCRARAALELSTAGKSLQLQDLTMRRAILQQQKSG